MSTRSHHTGRAASLVLTLVIVELTLTTAWIHFSLGGTLFTLNAIGYVGLAAAVAVSAAWPIGLIGRLAWLPRLGLALYTLATMGAYLVIGPYFALGWIAKAIEVAILTLLAAEASLMLTKDRGPAARWR
jgi:energy-converting hydrogenase Eha subunit H